MKKLMKIVCIALAISACCGCSKSSDRKVSSEEEALLKISETAVQTYYQRAPGKKVAGAPQAISEEKGGKAKSAVEDLDEDTIKKLGE